MAHAVDGADAFLGQKGVEQRQKLEEWTGRLIVDLPTQQEQYLLMGVFTWLVESFQNTYPNALAHSRYVYSQGVEVGIVMPHWKRGETPSPLCKVGTPPRTCRRRSEEFYSWTLKSE